MFIRSKRRDALVLIIGLMVAAASRAGAQSPCRSEPAYLTTFLTQELTRYVTATSGDNAVVRDSLRLPPATANDVQLVANDSLCTVAATAYAADRQGIGAGLSSRVFVIKIKTVYVVYDPDFDNYPVVGNPKTLVSIVFNSNWQALARY
jgi:hypothetical protein